MIFYVVVVNFSVALPSLQKEFGFPAATAILGYTLLYMGMAAGCWWGGIISGSLGSKWTVLVAQILLLGPQFALFHARSWLMVLGLRIIQGNAIAMFPALATMNNLWFPDEQRGLATGIFMGGMCLGAGISSVLGSVFLPWAGWRLTGVYTGVIALGVVVSWFVFYRDAPTASHQRKLSTEQELSHFTPAAGRSSIYTNPLTWLLVAITIANFWYIYSVYGVTPSLLYDLGYRAQLVGSLGTVLGSIGVISTLLGGVTSDFLGKKVRNPLRGRTISIQIGFLVAIVGALFAPWLARRGIATAFLAVIWLGFGIPWTNASIWSLPAELYPERMISKVTGLIASVGFLSAVFGPFLSLYLGERINWLAGYALIGGICILGIGAAWRISQVKSRYS